MMGISSKRITKLPCLGQAFNFDNSSVHFSSLQSLSRVQLFVTPWIAARQASLSITNSRSLPKLMFIESVISSSHLILCHPLLLLPLIPLSIRVFSNESTLRMHSYLAQELAPFPQKCGTIRLKGNIKTELCNIVPFTTICLSWKCWFSRRKWLMLEFTSYTWLNAYWVEEGNGGASLRGHPMLPKST